MMKWGAGQYRPIKKMPRWAWAILLLVYIIALYLMFMPGEPTIFSDIYIQHTVSPGETLYSIAREHYPELDWRKVVWELQEVNSIDALIFPGDTLWIPEVE